MIVSDSYPSRYFDYGMLCFFNLHISIMIISSLTKSLRYTLRKHHFPPYGSLHIGRIHRLYDNNSNQIIIINLYGKIIPTQMVTYTVLSLKLSDMILIAMLYEF